MAKLRAALLVLQCTMCLTIRVPVNWDSDGDVRNESFSSTNKPVEVVQPNIPKEYFQYTAVKPQFAVDIAASHGVQTPNKLYTSYPVRPHTGVKKPSFGKHYILDPQNEAYFPYQNFVNKSQSFKYVKPTSTSFEIYHPYKAEEPHLQELYKDPVLNKIKDDIRDSKNRLQKYEDDAGEPNIASDEYLESPEQIDNKLHPHRNVPARFEIHRPMRRPSYYRPPMKLVYRGNIMDHKFKHPLNQNYVKVSPMHYRPVKNHLQHLRQQHALKFDDERNEYPQPLLSEPHAEKPDGYDIYENGKANYIRLRNNLDESINKATLENRPSKSDKLELQKSEDYVETPNEEDEFVPIKNYAQVRKTETTKHLPRERAFLDADSYDEIKNAPRLREAIKSTKAQIVYSEEGYEDSAYDHAGEQKHASDHEEHGGHLAESERSKGKYKIPSVSTQHDEENGSTHKEQLLDGKKWKENKKNSTDELDTEDYSEDEHDDSTETEIHSVDAKDKIIKKSDDFNENEEDLSLEDQTYKTRNKRQDVEENISNTSNRSKAKTKFEVPEVNLNLDLSGVKPNNFSIMKPIFEPKDNVRLKYPYYFTKIAGISKDSPLRYAENLDLIPKKTNGGAEFYESRSKIVCPEIEEEVDPIPEDLKKGENPGDKDNKDEEFKKFNEKQRLKGLGDKIDCFKTKYFGTNPLDSPFFQEEIILSPKPIHLPKLTVFDRKYSTKKTSQAPLADNLGLYSKQNDVFSIFEGVYGKKNKSEMFKDQNIPFVGQPIKFNNVNNTHRGTNDSNSSSSSQTKYSITGYPKEAVTVLSRKRRANSFVYEPYKIIKESQAPDSKKTTTTSNISPLIKQLQSSRIIDRGSVKHNNGESLVKINTNSKIYQDIDDTNRQKYHSVVTNQSRLNEDKRRGEPRYDNELQNHKAYYTPVENVSAVTLEEYEEKMGIKVKPRKFSGNFVSQAPYENLRKNTVLSNTQQKASDHIDGAASNTVRNILGTTTLEPRTKTRQRLSRTNNYKKNEKHIDNDSNNSDNVESVSTVETSTVTSKTRAQQLRYVPERIVSTTDKSIEIEEADYVDESNSNQPDIKPKLELVTRFRSPSTVTANINKNYKRNNDSSIPKYREKKKKVTKSTLVTDTKSYGEDDDDMRNEDVDAMIGVKHDMDEYTPSYEKKTSFKRGDNAKEEVESDEHDEYEKSSEDGDVEEKEDNDSDENDDDVDVEDDDEEDEDDEDDADDDEDDEEFENENQENNFRGSQNRKDGRDIQNQKTQSTQTTSTTMRPTTTQKMPSPTILRKKIEIHKELPVNKSSPHLSQFMQDIKEIEIIKEIPPKPRRKHQKNSEVLQLYKDDNLAKDINKLGGVEIFKEDLDLKSGPKHGGNYKSLATQEVNDDATPSKFHSNHKSDIETSQTETKKHIDSSRRIPYGTRRLPNHKVNQQYESTTTKLTELEEIDFPQVKQSVQNRRTKQSSESKNVELSELVEEVVIPKPLHGGNLKKSRASDRSRHNKNEKYIELNDEDEDDNPRMHGGNFKSYDNNRNLMHGGNYKSAKIVEETEDVTKTPNDKTKRGRKLAVKDEKSNAASMLSGFARVVPILTTTPVYILDPSKRMYYYVDT